MDRTNITNSAVSVWLIATPGWAEVIHEISIVGELASTLIGLAIGAVTLYRLLRRK